VLAEKHEYRRAAPPAPCSGCGELRARAGVVIVLLLFLLSLVLRVTNRLLELDAFDCVLLQSPVTVLDPLYVRLQGASVVHLPKALKATGVLDVVEAWLLEASLVEGEEATVPLAAALAPRSWRLLLYLEGWCQEKGSRRAMFLPHPALAAITTEARRQIFLLKRGSGPLAPPGLDGRSASKSVYFR